jgi:hypothetical protein
MEYCCFVQYNSTPDRLESPMRNAHLRYLYRPTRLRAPRWLHRLWVWL